MFGPIRPLIKPIVEAIVVSETWNAAKEVTEPVVDAVIESTEEALHEVDEALNDYARHQADEIMDAWHEDPDNFDLEFYD